MRINVIEGLDDVEIAPLFRLPNNLTEKEKRFVKIGPLYSSVLFKDDNYYYCGYHRCEKIQNLPLIVGISFSNWDEFDDLYKVSFNKSNKTYRFQTKLFSEKIDKIFDDANNLMSYMILWYISNTEYDIDVGKYTIEDVINYTDLKLESNDPVYKGIKRICEYNLYDGFLKTLNDKILKK